MRLKGNYTIYIQSFRIFYTNKYFEQGKYDIRNLIFFSTMNGKNSKSFAFLI